MKPNEKFPFLDHFFGAYFHQDWTEIYESEEMLIKEFVSGESVEDVNSTLQELDQFIALDLPEDDLDRVMFDDLGCYYNPAPNGQTMAEWLRWVHDTMAKYAAEKVC